MIREGGRNVVERRRLPDGKTAVVKRMRERETLGLVDVAALRFLEEAAPRVAARVAPRVVSVDLEARELVMTDLGGNRTLETVLQSGDEAALRQAVWAMGQSMGWLHGATLGETLEERFLAACRLVGAPVHDRCEEAARWCAGLRRVREWCEAAGVRPAAGFEEAAALIENRYREPGEWLAFTHGDPAPSNAHLAKGFAGDVRLVDFEYGGYRHVLYDVTAWWVLCPLPAAIEKVLRAALRDGLWLRLPAVRSDRGFGREWATLVAYRGLAILSWLPLDVLREDHEWVEGWGARARLIATADRLEVATTGVEELAAVTETAARLARGLRRLWPEVAAGEVLPRWESAARRG